MSSRTITRGRLNIFGVDFDRNLNQIYNNYTFVRDNENLEFIVISEAQKLIADLNQSTAEENEVKPGKSQVMRNLKRIFRKH